MPASERTKLVRTEETSVSGIVVDIFRDLGLKHFLRGLLPRDGTPALEIPKGIDGNGREQVSYHCIELKPNQFVMLRSIPIEAK